MIYIIFIGFIVYFKKCTDFKTTYHPLLLKGLKGIKQYYNS